MLPDGGFHEIIREHRLGFAPSAWDSGPLCQKGIPEPGRKFSLDSS
jgi:hypothetical protein